MKTGQKKTEEKWAEKMAFVKCFYKLKRYENNGVIYCVWELILVTRAFCALDGEFAIIVRFFLVRLRSHRGHVPMTKLSSIFFRLDTREINSHTDGLNASGLSATGKMFTFYSPLKMNEQTWAVDHMCTVFILPWLIAMYQTHRLTVVPLARVHCSVLNMALGVRLWQVFRIHNEWYVCYEMLTEGEREREMGSVSWGSKIGRRKKQRTKKNRNEMNVEHRIAIGFGAVVYRHGIQARTHYNTV